MNRKIINSIVPEQEELDMLSFDDFSISSQDIKQLVFDKIKNDNEKGCNFMKKKMSFSKFAIAAVIMVCICCALCATGYAAKFAYEKYVNQHITDTITNEYKNPVEDGIKVDESQLEPAISVPSTYAESNGVKLNAVQTLGDKEYVYILVEAEAPEGYDIYKPADELSLTSFESISIEMDNVHPLTWGCYHNDEPSETNNKTTFVFYIVNDNEKIIDNNIRITFKNLKSSGSLPNINDEWVLSWKLSYQDISVDVTPTETIDLWGTEANFKNMRISPLSLSFELTGDFTDIKIPYDLTHENIGDLQPYDDLSFVFLDYNIDVLWLNFEDGSRYELKNIRKAIFTNAYADSFKLITTFREYIDPTQISSIEIAGNIIPVNAK